MAKSQENGITILLGLAGYEVGKVIEEEREIVVELGADLKKPACPRCDSARLYRHGRAKKRRVLHGISRLFVTAGDAVIVDIPLPEVWS